MPEIEAMAVAELFRFEFNIEKTESCGEDADPVFIQHKNAFFLGVFDGLGGAGSSIYPINDTTKSGAYIASRLVAEQVQRILNDIMAKGDYLSRSATQELQATLAKILKQKVFELRKGDRILLKSKLLKELPTTFSGIYIKKELKLYITHSIWAGDSRNYSLTPERGLQQLTEDDLKLNYDPLENLSKDSPLKNIISSEGDFELHFDTAVVNPPCIIFSATDGCYGYFNSPMEFEWILLDTMSRADNVEQWQQNLKSSIGKVSGDDYSMVLLGLEFSSFSNMKNQFEERKKTIDTYCEVLMRYVESVKSLQDRKLNIEAELRKADESRLSEQKSIWEEYRKVYLQYIQK
jgi:serine/threonine protein phosphatase PrpC